MTTYLRILGSAGTKPTKNRNVTSTLVCHGSVKFLIDVGEGTTRQLLRYKQGLDLDAVFITHGHGDHVWGLPGLIECMTAYGRTAPLGIYCGNSTRGIVEHLLKLTTKKRNYSVEVYTVVENLNMPLAKDACLKAIKLTHSFAGTVGYVLSINVPARIDPGKLEVSGVSGAEVALLLKNGVVTKGTHSVSLQQVQSVPQRTIHVFLGGDTRPVKHEFYYDLMVYECTFPDNLKTEAIAAGHSTISEALGMLKNTQLLVLNHIGERAEDALRRITLPDKVVLAVDGLRFDILK